MQVHGTAHKWVPHWEAIVEKRGGKIIVGLDGGCGLSNGDRRFPIRDCLGETLAGRRLHRIELHR
jgi:hypothetical protein